MTNKQQHVLDFVAAHPGCSIADVVRSCWGGRGHSAEYDRVHRLRRNRELVVRRGPSGITELYIPSAAPLKPTEVSVSA